MKYFSVKRKWRIAGRAYQPYVCYKLEPYMRDFIIELKENGCAETYENKVYFTGGIAKEYPTVKVKVKKAEKANEEVKKAEKSNEEVKEAVEVKGVEEEKTNQKKSKRNEGIKGE